MASKKAGVLSVNERIVVLEAVVLPGCGTIRCRFADGWISQHAGNGDVILEKSKEKSQVTLRCDECVLDKDAYDICMKMARTSRLKNVAILMKINLKAMEIVMVHSPQPPSLLTLLTPQRLGATSRTPSPFLLCASSERERVPFCC